MTSLVVNQSDVRTFCDLIVHCEVRELACRIALVVGDFFRLIAEALADCLNLSSSGSLEATAIVAISADEETDASSHIDLLLTPQVDPLHKSWIINAVAAIPEDQRADVLHYVALLVLQMEAGVEVSSWLLIQVIAAIPADERPDVLHQVAPLLNPQMSGFEQARIIKAVGAIPTGERVNVLHHASLFLTENLFAQVGCFDVQQIFEALAFIPLDLRAERVQRALGQIQLEQFPNPFGVLPRFRVIALLQTPLDQPLPPLGGGMAAVAAAGGAYINIHQDNRDQLTKNALELLRAHQGPIDNIENPVTDFVTYVTESVLVSEEQKERALFALQGPKQDGEAFGSLLDDEFPFSILGFVISGRELITRLWHFASQQMGEESTNAKLGMISALDDSYSGDARVCNQGKTQRLVIAVLSGRLAGVNIDAIPMAVSTPQAEAMFFAVATNQNHATRATLFAAANAFCAENPGVDPVEFLQKINTFADLQQLV